MKRVDGRYWKLTSTMLLVFLVVAQTGALAHAYQHDPGTLQDTTCASCVSAGELTSACLDSGIAADISAFHSCLETDQQVPIESIATLSARQRGPPGRT